MNLLWQNNIKSMSTFLTKGTENSHCTTDINRVENLNTLEPFAHNRLPSTSSWRHTNLQTSASSWRAACSAILQKPASFITSLPVLPTHEVLKIYDSNIASFFSSYWNINIRSYVCIYNIQCVSYIGQGYCLRSWC